MSPKVPSPGSAAEKWARVTPTRQSDYQTGVQGAAQRYQDGVNNAGSSWSGGVQAAISNNSYEQGVAGKGGHYAQQAATIGAPRWAQGVGSARPRYEQGITRVFAAISAVNLPAKGPKGSPQNLNRVQAIVDAERAARFH
jgi:hypothetical protein